MRFDLIYIASLAITWGLCIALYYFLRIPGLPWLGTGGNNSDHTIWNPRFGETIML